MNESETTHELTEFLQLLSLDDQAIDESEVNNTPVFTEAVRQSALAGEAKDGSGLTQYGLLGADVPKLRGYKVVDGAPSQQAPFIYYNIKAPSSVFICGSQGSGKSHTLSCLLENFLIPSQANRLPEPLTGIVFHFDPFLSEDRGNPCEAAYLSSHPQVKVRVLCPPTNVGPIKRAYKGLPNVDVQELRLGQGSLTTRRMLDLMAVSPGPDGSLPLYCQIVIRILRDLRIKQQLSGGGFNYGEFKQELSRQNLTPGQKGPLEQRLDTLESFMAKEDVEGRLRTVCANKTATTWMPKAGHLTIVDLSCPTVTAESACAMFNICLSLFLEQDTLVGRVVALDEAHKYMTDGGESQALTEALLSSIRLQRHLGTRLLIATQEPTISPKLLDLCSVTIVHRFSSPAWLETLKRHLAAATAGVILGTGGYREPVGALMDRIVALRQGEALLFSPSAIVDIGNGIMKHGTTQNGQNGCTNGAGSANGEHDVGTDQRVVHLGQGIIHIRVRKRITQDGGKSVMAG